MSHMYTYVPSLLNLPPNSSLSHPSRLSQNTSFGFPASYSKLPLAIYFTYGNMKLKDAYSLEEKLWPT